jgi:hypothetical protein
MAQDIGPEPGTVAHSCNPSYSEGRDQEDFGSKPARANNSWDSISKKTLHNEGPVEWIEVKALRKRKKKLCK